MEKNRNFDLADTALGIEFGSTRIKAVLTDTAGRILARGEYVWENSYAGGLWTYPLSDVWAGLRVCYGRMKTRFREKTGVVLTRVGAIGVSGMMHGYLAFGADGGQLAPFRTWRNNNAAPAAQKLTELFGFRIPARWSIAHLYQAMTDGETYLPRLDTLTTLAGCVHRALTGRRVVGIGEASGIFPVDVRTKSYDTRLTKLFDTLAEERKMPWRLADILPEIALAGEEAGTLTPAGARLLDAAGDLAAGIPLCAPEGDAGTGMVATDSVRRRTGNVSAGTSIFGTAVLDRPLSAVYDAIDVVTTPAGDAVAMVHCNNCTSDFNAWAGVFSEFAEAVRAEKTDVYRLLCEKSLTGEPDCGGVLNYNYVSGENITGIGEGRPLCVRKTESRLTLANFARSQLYSAIATLKIGTDLLRGENVKLDSVVGHGGLFKTEGVCQRYLAAALNAPVTVLDTADEGGAWGMALLAAYMLRGGGASLADWLDREIFADRPRKTLAPRADDVAGFEKYIAEFRRGLPVVQTAVTALGSPSASLDARLKKLRNEVYAANMQLVEKGLVLYTWGNASGIDRAAGLVVIKPSGVDYGRLTADDMVVVDLGGKVVAGKYQPSSDTPTHLELYKAHSEIGGVVHTHSTYATAFAQAGRSIPAYGTTHADYFYGDVPCTRALTAAEIADGYERNTGVVLNETLTDGDALRVPAALVRNHGPFAWGKDAASAVYHATVLEEIAQTALLTERLNPAASRADRFLLDKHYFRKHGKNAYYGQ